MRKRTHVLVFAPVPPPFAGPEVATSMLLKAFPADRVSLCHVRSNIRLENAKKGAFDFAGIKRFLGLYLQFCMTILRERPDKVYFLLSSGKVGFLRDSVIVWTSVLSGRRVLAHYRGSSFRHIYESYGPYFRWYVRTTLRLLDMVIVQAERLKSLFTGLVPDEKLRVLYNGLDLDGRPERSAAGDEQKPFTFLFMGHLAFAKGFYELVVAFKKLSRELDIRLEFAGERAFVGKNRAAASVFLEPEHRALFSANCEKIEQEIADFTDHAESYGAKYLGIIRGEEKEAAFARADALVLPSYSEGFSMSVLEAMANGLPVVVTPVGALPEVVESGVNGLFVSPGEAGELAETLKSLVNDRKLATKIGSRNAAYTAERFNVTRIAREWESILAA